MTERPNRPTQIRRPLNYRSDNSVRQRRPFWLPASNYYILAAAAALALFFLVCGVLHEGGEQIPWVPAGISSSMVLVGAVFLREIVLRKARNRYLLVEQRLDRNLDHVTVRQRGTTTSRKMSPDENASIIRRIQEKSDAAKVLMKLGAGHREVFEMCREYLAVNQRELELAGAGSPRLAGLLRGRETVRAMHKFHLLAWAEVESTQLTQAARTRVTIKEKSAAVEQALTVIRSALEHYPSELRLTESEQAVMEFATSIRVGHFVEQAERAAFKGNYKRAVSHYKDALYFLAREGVRNAETEQLAERINSEIKNILEVPTVKGLGIDGND